MSITVKGGNTKPLKQPIKNTKRTGKSTGKIASIPKNGQGEEKPIPNIKIFLDKL